MAALTLPPPGSLTVASDPLRVAAAFLAGYGTSTRDAYWRDLQRWAAWCATHDLTIMGARRVHVDLYTRQQLEQGAAPSSVSRRLSTLSGFYRYAQDEGLIGHNPVDRIRRPRVPDTSPRSGLDRAEAAGILACPDPRDAAVVGLLILNGLRASEVGRLDVDDYSHDRGHRIVTVAGKGGRVDVLPLAPRLADAIDQHLSGRDTGPLVEANDGDRLDRHRVARIVRRVARAAGITRRVCPHDLRHAFVTHGLAAGVPLHTVQDGARHADPRTTRRYDRAARSLDQHATYTLATYLAA